MGAMISAILAFLMACLLIWVLKGDSKEQAKKVRNELGRRALLWVVVGVVAIMILISVVAVHDSNVQQVQEDNSSYYTHDDTRDDTSDDNANETYDNKYDCEKDMNGVWVDVNSYCIREPLPDKKQEVEPMILEAGEHVVGEDVIAGDYNVNYYLKGDNDFTVYDSNGFSVVRITLGSSSNEAYFSCSKGYKIKTQATVILNPVEKQEEE